MQAPGSGRGHHGSRGRLLRPAPRMMAGFSGRRRGSAGRVRAVSSSAPPPGAPVLCLGEALVDLICERHLEDAADAGTFVPHFGGAVANIALLAARAGAPVALAGATGSDRWGHWLQDQLSRAGVYLARFSLLENERTPLALVTIDPRGEAAYTIYGEPSGWIARAVGSEAGELAERCAALFLSSNTLVEPGDREVSMRLRERFLQLARPVIFDPNLRLHRWRSRTAAAAEANRCVPGALLVRANRDEAELMTREDD